jgi:hypothetical protein
MTKDIKQIQEWQPIEKFKKGRSIFYYPPEMNKSGKIKLTESFDVDIMPWHTRQASHFITLPKLPKEVK